MDTIDDVCLEEKIFFSLNSIPLIICLLRDYIFISVCGAVRWWESRLVYLDFYRSFGLGI